MTQERSDSNNVASLLEKIIQDHPSSPALIAPDGECLSYEKLGQIVDRVGRILQSLNISKTDTVAVMLPNGMEIAAAFLGISCHAICAPLNPGFRSHCQLSSLGWHQKLPRLDWAAQPRLLFGPTCFP